MPKRTCSLADCNNTHAVRGYCRTHYERWKRHGDPYMRTRSTVDTEFNFWEKVDKRTPESCWPWLAYVTPGGYAKFTVCNKSVFVYRYSYELHVGPIPDGMQIDHVKARGCVRRDCVNPAHLEPVTPQVNTLRSGSLSAFNAQKTHCLRGHEFTEANIYVSPTGGRRCRTCRKEQKLLRNERARAKR